MCRLFEELVSWIETLYPGASLGLRSSTDALGDMFWAQVSLSLSLMTTGETTAQLLVTQFYLTCFCFYNSLLVWVQASVRTNLGWCSGSR